MSYAITIDVPVDTARPALTRLRNKLRNPARLHKAAARGALPVLQEQFRENARTNKNKFGARGSFWNRMLSGTRVETDANAATLAMPAAIGLRVHGGTVEPVKSKYLAIPARKQAHGKSPRDFNDLRFVPLLGRGKGGALVQREQQKISYKKDGTIGRGRKLGGRDKEGRLPVFYWLVPSATIQGDKTLLPTKAQLLAGAEQGLRAYLRPKQETTA